MKGFSLNRMADALATPLNVGTLYKSEEIEEDSEPDACFGSVDHFSED
jgi:hypothetical protein